MLNHPKTNSVTNTSTVLSEPTISARSPIGVFDSGVGGLSVFLHLQRVLPNEQYLYFADTLHVPYGDRSSQQIEELTMQAVDWLCEQGCKLIVIACNSASAHGLQVARQKYPNIPIVGLVPALKPAVTASKSKKVAVLATAATLEGDLLNQVIDTIAVPNNVQVIKWFEPNLVPWVEEGMPEDSATAMDLKQHLHYFCQQGVDHIVLGCTHYPFFTNFLLAEINQQRWNITVMDSGFAIASRVYDLLQQKNLLLTQNGADTKETWTQPAHPPKRGWQQQAQLQQGILYFYATQYNNALGQLVKRLLNHT